MLTINGKLDRTTGKPATIYTPPEDLIDPVPTPADVAKPWRHELCCQGKAVDPHHECPGIDDTDTMLCRCGCHDGVEILERVRLLRAEAEALLALSLDGVLWDDAVRIHHELSMVSKAVGVEQGFLSELVHDHWPAKWSEPQVVSGVGQVKPYRTPDRKSWQHDELVKAVVDANLEQLDGEIPDPFTVARWIREAAGLARWKSSVLRKLGLDVDEFCETSPGRRTLQITSNDGIGGAS